MYMSLDCWTRYPLRAACSRAKATNVDRSAFVMSAGMFVRV